MEEEEDLEEVEFILPKGETRLIMAEEEDTPATNTRSHAPRMNVSGQDLRQPLRNQDLSRGTVISYYSI
jgi:hypothetical protein